MDTCQKTRCLCEIYSGHPGRAQSDTYVSKFSGALLAAAQLAAHAHTHRYMPARLFRFPGHFACASSCRALRLLVVMHTSGQRARFFRYTKENCLREGAFLYSTTANCLWGEPFFILEKIALGESRFLYSGKLQLGKHFYTKENSLRGFILE